MKIYFVLLLQWLIWSAYTLMEWLSKHDHPLYNGIMFMIFLYFAIKSGNYVIQSTLKTLFTTLVSLSIYVSFYVIMALI
jgi:hypothetical protein